MVVLIEIHKSNCITDHRKLTIPMGYHLCQKSVFFNIYERRWYLCTMLVFTSDAGIFAGCWYLQAMLVFMHDAGIYGRCWYL